MRNKPEFMLIRLVVKLSEFSRIPNIGLVFQVLIKEISSEISLDTTRGAETLLFSE